MKKLAVRQCVVLLMALVSVSSVAAKTKPGFSGNVCALLTAKQVTAIAGLTSVCKNQKPLPAPGSTLYVGNWAGSSSKGPTLQVSVAVYTDSGFLQLADHNLKQGLPGGTPKPVKGIGDAAYEAKGAFAAGIHLGVGKYVVYITLNEIGKTPSPALIKPVAKDVAAKF